MALVNIIINDKKISAQGGISILQAAREAGIDIPTLCNHPALPPSGGCRMCIVEIKGQRTLQTACTFPVSEGLEIQTDSPQTVKARKLVLDMLFSERNHFCPYCERSGFCELQDLGYRLGIDHWVFPTYTKSFPLDASHKYYLMEHNRCILCGRCVRACDEVVANHTLGLRQRGSESMIHADTHIPLGQSSCVSCGTCVQVCPTGALSEKRSAFMGRDDQTEKIRSTCSQCSVGCGMIIMVRGGNIVRIGSDWEAPVNKGLLCIHGRFEPLYDNRSRILSPLIRSNGRLIETSWEQAMQTLAKRSYETPAREIGLLISSHVTNEALYVTNALFRENLLVNNIGLLNRTTPEIRPKPQGSLTELDATDIIVLIGANPAQDQPVASYMIKRACDRGAHLIIVDEKENGLYPFAYSIFNYDEMDKAIDIVNRAAHPVVLYGADIPAKTINELKKINNQASFIALEQGVNTRAAAAMKLYSKFNPSPVKFLYILTGDENYDNDEIFKSIPKEAFVAVQASFSSPLTERADLVLPAAIWSERSGSLTNTEGRVQQVQKAVEPAGEAKADWETLSLLAEQLGKKFDISMNEIPNYISRLINERRS